MSSSLTREENVIFAMAPLGIITAMVGAIRVGGPPWLRALIGRAKENRADAEKELMSSTSHEVCELYNGESIVRVMGTPQIQEFLYFEERSSDRETYGVYTIEEAVNDNLLTLKEGKRLFASTFQSLYSTKGVLLKYL